MIASYLFNTVRRVRGSSMGIRSVARSFSGVSLPPNLELPDLSVLEPPPPSIVDPLTYLFPQKMGNISAPVKKFLDPDATGTEEVTLDPRVFGVAIRQDIIHQIVRYQRAKIRQPQMTKRTGDIRGSTRKLYQQKGTGRHRVGQSRKPGRRGGPKAHGPVLRDFSFSLNRKMRAMGMMIAVAAKYREGNLVVYDSIKCENHKTKELTQLLEKHDLLGSLTLFIDEVEDENFALASRNLQHVKFLPQHKANVYDIVRREKVAISVAGLAALQERLISQRYYLGKKKAVLNELQEYNRLKELGATLPEEKNIKTDVSME